MIPIVDIPDTVKTNLLPYRSIFCKEAGFEHVGRYISGLILSPNKTLQGIYDAQVWGDEKPSRRAMHEAVFESSWNSEGFLGRHREIVSRDHHGKGKEVISLDWTLGHHLRGPQIYGIKKGYDYVEDKYCLFQTVLTAVISNQNLVDGIDVVVQEPFFIKKEKAYLKATTQPDYEQMEKARQRLLELLHYNKHCRDYKKCTEIAVEIVVRIEEEGLFPLAHYAFDNGVLCLELTKCIEKAGKHWVSKAEKSRNVMWNGKWTRVDAVDEELCRNNSESFREIEVLERNGEKKKYWVFTKTLRLKRYGRKRLVIIHESQDLSDTPRFLLTDAKHWNAVKVIQVWSYRWSSEVFHEFGKQNVGMESAQLRNEEAVKRHFYLSCVAQSFIQRASASVSTSEKFAFAQGKITVGQKCRAIAREAFTALLNLTKRLFGEGKSVDNVLEVLMPA
jgi:hypothetical protein